MHVYLRLWNVLPLSCTSNSTEWLYLQWAFINDRRRVLMRVLAYVSVFNVFFFLNLERRLQFSGDLKCILHVLVALFFHRASRSLNVGLPPSFWILFIFKESWPFERHFYISLLMFALSEHSLLSFIKSAFLICAFQIFSTKLDEFPASWCDWC